MRRSARSVFDSARAVELADAGERVILVRRETNPDDLPGMIAAQGILTSRGGKTSHAAVVARGMGKTCVCGADALNVDVAEEDRHRRRHHDLGEGDLVSIDGTSGKVYLGEVPVQPSPVVRYFEGDTAAVKTDALVAGRRPDAQARRRQAPPRWSAPTPTPVRTPRAPAASAPRASACAVPSTCSSATGASWSSG